MFTHPSIVIGLGAYFANNSNITTRPSSTEKQQRAIEEAQAALDIGCHYKFFICVGLTVVLGLITAAVVYMGYFMPREN